MLILAPQVTAAAQVEESFAASYFLVADYFLRAHRKADEEGHNHGDEDVNGDVLVFTKNVAFQMTTRIEEAHEEGKNHCQYRRFEQIDQYVLTVGKLGKQVALYKYAKLLEHIGYSEMACRQCLNLFFKAIELFDMRFVQAVPFKGRNLSLMGEVAKFIHHLGFNDVEYFFGLDMPA
jgi:hypothetical protein